MSYDHARKAGNLGAVWKHAVLVSIASRLPAAPSFRYVESHAGGPCHRLHELGEWQRGIGQVLKGGDDREHPYLGAARQKLTEARYPAGWVFFACAPAPRVTSISVTLCDLSPDGAQQYSALPAQLHPNNIHVDFRQIDGYSHLDVTEADLVFLDPPFHPKAEADWKARARACLKLRARGVSYLAWYPFYWPSRPRSLVETTLESAWEVAWAPCGARRHPRFELPGAPC